MAGSNPSNIIKRQDLNRVLTIEEMDANLNELVNVIQDILQTEVVVQGPSGLLERTTIAEQSIVNLENSVVTLQSKSRIFRQPVQPTTGMSTGDMWIDTDDGNRIYIYNGTAWDDSRDDGIAQALQLAQSAESLADGKVTTYIQPTPPGTGMSEGDIWFDSDNNNAMYRYNSSQWVSVKDGDITVALAAAQNAQIIADGKVQTFYQDFEPQLDIGLGDLWFDTNDGNRLYRYDGVDWVSVQDQAVTDAVIAAAEAVQAVNDLVAAGSDLVSFFQTTPPVTGMSVGDLWFDTDDNNKLYRYDGTSWVLAQDQSITQAIDTADLAFALADGKIKTFYSDEQPTTEISIGDLWFDTNDGNRLYYYNGTTWINVQDEAIAQAISTAELALETADGKIQTFYQPAQPASGMSVGDLWFDTDNGNLLHRYNGTNWVAAQDSAISQAINAAADAQSTADGKITTFIQSTTPTADGVGDLWYNSTTKAVTRWSGTAWVNFATYGSSWSDVFGTGKPADNATVNHVYRQAAAPTVGMVASDLWIDTDDNNRLYYYTGSSWVDSRDLGITQALSNAANAQATADGKIRTFYQTTAPSSGMALGDLWFNQSTNNTLYRYNGSSWVSVRDAGITQALANAANAQATADGRIRTYFQTAQPASGMVNGDLWFDTDDGNRLYRYNGTSWLDAQDDAITQAIADAATAQATADGKIETFFQPSQPSLVESSLGDLWFDTDDGNKMYRFNGSAWVAAADTAIADAIQAAADAQATADGKIETFFQTTTPTAEGIGDLWYNSDTQVLKRWDGVNWTDVSNFVNTELGDSSDLIYNGNHKLVGIDGGPAGIAAFGGGASIPGDVVRWGDKANGIVQIYSNTISQIGAIYRAFKVDPGTKYRIFVRVRLTSASPGTAVIAMAESTSDILANSAQFIKAVSYAGETGVAFADLITSKTVHAGSLTTSWQNFEYIYEPTLGAKWASLFFRRNSDIASTTRIEIQMVSATPVINSDADNTQQAVDIGIVTTGGITLSTDGMIKTFGKTSVNDTVEGLMLGDVSGDKVFYVGDGQEDFIKYVENEGLTLGKDVKIKNALSFASSDTSFAILEPENFTRADWNTNEFQYGFDTISKTFLVSSIGRSGIQATHYNRFQYGLGPVVINRVSWDKDVSLTFAIANYFGPALSTYNDNVEIHVGLGYAGNSTGFSTNKGLGFRFKKDAIDVWAANGTSNSSTFIPLLAGEQNNSIIQNPFTNTSISSCLVCRIEKTATRATFTLSVPTASGYASRSVDITTNLPTGAFSPRNIISLYIRSLTGSGVVTGGGAVAIGEFRFLMKD